MLIEPIFARKQMLIEHFTDFIRNNGYPYGYLNISIDPTLA